MMLLTRTARPKLDLVLPGTSLFLEALTAVANEILQSGQNRTTKAQTLEYRFNVTNAAPPASG